MEQDYSKIRKKHPASDIQRKIVKDLGISRNIVAKHCTLVVTMVK